jgi:hypothetical protein
MRNAHKLLASAAVLLATIGVAYGQTACFKSTTLTHTVTSVDRTLCNPNCGTKQSCMDFYFRVAVDCTTAGDTSCTECVLWELFYYDTDLQEQILWDSAQVGAGTVACATYNGTFVVNDMYKCESPGYDYTSFAWVYNLPCNQVDDNSQYAAQKIVYFSL